MFRGKTVREHFRVTATFDRPILDWTNLPQSFFEAIHEKLGETLFVRASDFALNAPTNSPGDITLVFRIYGGESTVTLTAQTFVVDFPNLTPDTYQVAIKTFHLACDAVSKVVTIAKFKSIVFSDSQHVQLLDDKEYTDLIASCEITSVKEYFREKGGGTFDQGVKYLFTSSDQSWVLQFQIEKSLTVANGLFGTLELQISDLNKYPSTESQLELVGEANKLVLNSIKLQMVD